MYKRKKLNVRWLTWNVGDHDDNEEGVVIKREVVFVGEGDRVQARLLHVGQRGIDGQQLPCHSHGIEHDEEGVSKAEGIFQIPSRNIGNLSK